MPPFCNDFQKLKILDPALLYFPRFVPDGVESYLVSTFLHKLFQSVGPALLVVAVIFPQIENMLPSFNHVIVVL